MTTSQPSSPQSSRGQSAASPLRPELARVLGSLTVHLDDELLRYRRQMRGQAPIPSRRVQPTQAKPSLDLISVPAQRASAAPVAAAQVAARPPGRPVPPPPPPNPFLKKSAPVALLADDLTEAGHPIPRSTEQLASPPDGTDPVKALAADAAAGMATNTAAQHDAAVSEVAPESTTAFLPDDAVTPGSDTADIRATSPELTLQETQADPDGYLESSEALLKSLADEAELPPTNPTERPPKPYNPNSRQSSLPLKLGTLLLLLTASSAVGYAIINPAVLDPARNWFAARFATPDTEAGVGAGPNDVGQNTGGQAPGGQREFVPPGPDLSAREFVDLDLGRLSTLDVDSTTPTVLPPAANGTLPTPTAEATTAPPAAPATAATPATAPSPATTSDTPVPATTPSAGATPSAGTAAPAPATSTTPNPAAATGGNYYVVTGFTGDASLATAREVVSDAFVRNFSDGAYIQMAAFDNQASAEAQISELQQRGLTVQLYGPTDE